MTTTSARSESVPYQASPWTTARPVLSTNPATGRPPAPLRGRSTGSGSRRRSPPSRLRRRGSSRTGATSRRRRRPGVLRAPPAGRTGRDIRSGAPRPTGRSVEFAVLVKVVPAAESAKFDPVRKTIRRDEGELFLNPFDQRALRVALDLRRPGETVTVVSMGPPSAASAVQETLALGVDRAILVSDPVLAGSDSLVTARVLERVLVEYPADLVLAGKWTTDSETGQVPAELAELLGRPLLTAARRLVRAPAADTFEVTVETETGSARATFAAPAVVSVGEKIAKPAKRAEDGTAVSSPGNLTRLDAAQLGFAADEVGLPGSPTVVRALVDRAPRRTPVVFDGGTAEERVRGAVAALRGLLANPARGSGDPDLRRFDGPRSGTAFALVSDERG